MTIACPSLLQCLSWILFIACAIAQSGCEGDATTYDRDGLIVPFRNLCGKDITAVVDFLDPTDEPTWSDCLTRCVEKAPLCYGFDFTTPGFSNFSCWLMNATFDESSALPQPYTVDAAMLTPAFLLGLADNCRSLGLMGCYEKNNGRLGTQITTMPPATTTMGEATLAQSGAPTVTTISRNTAPEDTSRASSQSNEKDRSLSLGAKAGLGAGIGILILLVLLGGFAFIRKRRKRRFQTSQNPSHDVGKVEDQRVELPTSPNAKVELDSMNASPIMPGSPSEVAGNNLYGMSELEGPPNQFNATARQQSVHELGTSSRSYEDGRMSKHSLSVR